MNTNFFNRFSVVFLVMGLFLIGFFVWQRIHAPKTVVPNNPPQMETLPREENNTVSVAQKEIRPFQPPIDRALERVTKKPFGIFITKENSPIQPERFSGYHTGTDFEIFLEEMNAPITIKAMCDGTLLLKKYASGYGGVAVQSCTDDNARSITVVYGHLKLTSISTQKGSTITQGDVIGILGAGNSTETDGERKHLHLGIHQGNTINLLGYVGRKTDLTSWIDPLSLLANK